ncbi:hypothetical protein C8D87_11494 [Lentzea atacamensis]|uniref:Uncharacterized protein n=1 Tax=Lentzea atacamensis TaxID=531938 RepID=A0ABX9DWK8_9PSEU|nr:hypothetical protein [Lentzea atacamensis]RAS59482.1 hypothetical protein C8D87_11494 [Lentzea atacamensis]
MSTSSATPVIPARDIVLVDPDTGDELATVTATVVSVVRKEEPGVLTYLASARQKEANPRYGWMIGLEAHLQIATASNPKPHSYFLSRLVDEPYWLQDAHFGPNGSVDFSHGFGDRTVNKKTINQELQALLNEAARTLGFVDEIGTGAPLVLTASSSDAGAQPPA